MNKENVVNPRGNEASKAEERYKIKQWEHKLTVTVPSPNNWNKNR